MQTQVFIHTNVFTMREFSLLRSIRTIAPIGRRSSIDISQYGEVFYFYSFNYQIALIRSLLCYTLDGAICHSSQNLDISNKSKRVSLTYLT
jgi:hypothetical protein